MTKTNGRKICWSNELRGHISYDKREAFKGKREIKIICYLNIAWTKWDTTWINHEREGGMPRMGET